MQKAMSTATQQSAVKWNSAGVLQLGMMQVRILELLERLLVLGVCDAWAKMSQAHLATANCENIEKATVPFPRSM
jgi:hypothetical protein